MLYAHRSLELSQRKNCLTITGGKAGGGSLLTGHPAPGTMLGRCDGDVAGRRQGEREDAFAIVRHIGCVAMAPFRHDGVDVFPGPDTQLFPIYL